MTPPAAADPMPRYERVMTILVDYNGQFGCTLLHAKATLSLERLREFLEAAGWQVDIRTFQSVDVRDPMWRDRFVFYQSAQDRDLIYKGYIEDVVLALSLAGAVVVPEFPKLRAHHNKVFMELLRDSYGDEALSSLSARHFGTLEDFEASVDALQFPVVLKAASTQLSRGVELARTKGEALKIAKKLMQSFHPVDAVNRVWWERTRDDYESESLHRRKIIAQEFVPDMGEDERVMVFGDRYLWVNRAAKPGDFRASGSGMARTFHREPLPGLLETARHYNALFDVPYVSMDIIRGGDAWHLIEFQFVRFGYAALQPAPHYFVSEPDGSFRLVDEKPDLEGTMAYGMTTYLDKKYFGGSGAEQ